MIFMLVLIHFVWENKTDFFFILKLENKLPSSKNTPIIVELLKTSSHQNLDWLTKTRTTTSTPYNAPNIQKCQNFTFLHQWPPENDF